MNNNQPFNPLCIDSLNVLITAEITQWRKKAKSESIRVTSGAEIKDVKVSKNQGEVHMNCTYESMSNHIWTKSYI